MVKIARLVLNLFKLNSTITVRGGEEREERNENLQKVQIVLQE